MAGPSHLQEEKRRSLLTALPLIVAYCISAVSLSFLNAGILRTVPCPAALSAWQWAVCTLLVLFIRLVVPSQFDPDGERLDTGSIVLRLVPVGMLSTAALGLGTFARGGLSESFVQMIAALRPVLTYFIGCIAGAEDFFRPKLQALCIISIGVVFASFGGYKWNAPALTCQAFATLAVCSKFVLISMLINPPGGGPRPGPLQTLAFFAPLASAFSAILAVGTEMPQGNELDRWKMLLREEVGYEYVIASGVNCFVLNILLFLVMHRADAVIYSVAVVVKGVLTDAFSAMALAAPVSTEELLGYLLALIGVQCFEIVQKRPDDFEDAGSLIFGLVRTFQAFVEQVSSSDGKERAVAAKQALNTELDIELDRDLCPDFEEVPPPSKVFSPAAARLLPGATPVSHPGAVPEVFEIGDDDDDEHEAPTG